MATTATSAQQSTPAADSGADEEALKGKVQRAFALGWHVAELRSLKWDAPTDTSDDPLPPAPELDVDTRATLLVAQISADLDWLGIEQSGPMRPLGAATGAPAGTGTGPTVKLEPIELPPLAGLDGAGAEAAAESLHRPILLRLTVSSAELGKAYSLGVALARTVLEAYQSVQSVPAAALAETDPGEGLKRVKGAVAGSFTEQRVRELWSDLKDLKSRFPPHASDPIAAGVTDWSRWAAGSATRRGQAPDRDQLLTTSVRLRRQGQLWRALLSGERKPTDVLLTADYIDGAIDLVRKYAGLLVRTLGANSGVLLVALFVLAAIGAVIIVVQGINSSFLTWIAGLLAALGVTGAGIVATVRSLAAAAEQALWETELMAAIGVAISYVPAVPENSEVHKLRDDKPGPSKGPVVEVPPKPAS